MAVRRLIAALYFSEIRTCQTPTKGNIVNEHTHVYEGRELEAATNLINYYQWITDCFRPFLQGSGTEVGAGLGTYSQYLRPYFTSLDVVEPSPNQLPALTLRFRDDPAVRVFANTIDNYRQEVGDNSRDCFCLVNVLEHIEEDFAALNNMSAMLKDGGHICIFVPALPILYSKLDRILQHYRRYTHDELTQKVSSAGFEIVQSHYMDLLGVPAWGLINTLMGSTSLSPKMAAVYDTACVPITRAIEAVMPIPFGKSLLVVGRKRV